MVAPGVDDASRSTPAYRVAASYEEGPHHARLAQPLSGHNPGSCPDTRSKPARSNSKDPSRYYPRNSDRGNENTVFLRVLQEIGQPFDGINVWVVWLIQVKADRGEIAKLGPVAPDDVSPR